MMDHGVSLQSIMPGEQKVPPQWTRFGVAFEGPGKGRLSGRLRGVDYVRRRADGRIDLDLRATIETDDGVGALHEGEPISDPF